MSSSLCQRARLALSLSEVYVLVCLFVSLSHCLALAQVMGVLKLYRNNVVINTFKLYFVVFVHR